MDFVTQQIAQKLKEKGFDYPCVGHYVNNHLYIAHYQNAFHSDNDESLDAPTISQVLKWLRDEKKLYVYPYLVQGKNGLKWDFNIDDLNTSDIIYESRAKYSSYEEASNAGIDYVLDYVVK